MDEAKEKARERVQEIAAEFRDRGDVLGWFDALYGEAGDDPTKIPWADLEPNHYFSTWAKDNGLEGNGRSALVVGCGLGDDAKLLSDLGFKVTAFDISPKAIEWAKRLYPDAGIEFVAADLFKAPEEWKGAFGFVLEIYTIQPLPMEMRSQVIDAIAEFVKPGGELVVVTRGREDDEESDKIPWPLSRKDLSRFETHGLVQQSFTIMPAVDEGEPDRFVVLYQRQGI